MKSEIDRMRSDILDGKEAAKEQQAQVLGIRDGHLETKIYIKLIQDSQTLMAQESKDNQKETMDTLKEMKDKPINDRRQVKIGLWIFGVSYIAQSALGLIKAFAPQLFK